MCGVIDDVVHSVRKYNRCDGRLLEATQIGISAFRTVTTIHKFMIEAVFQ